MQSSAEPVLPVFASHPSKSIFESKTFWGAVSTAVVAITPAVTDMVKEFLKNGRISPLTIFKISLLLTTTGLTIIGRIDAETPVYTPDGLPGPNRTEFSQSKSIFESKTFWGAVSTALLAILPAIADLIDKFQKTGRIDPGSIFNITMLLATTTLTIIGRLASESSVYTPAGLPGPNKPQA